MDNPSYPLSIEAPLSYVLRLSGCHGRITTGRIERSVEGLNVYDAQGSLFEYLCGNALRSWCVIDPMGVPVSGWSHIEPEDVHAVLSGHE